MDGEVVKNFEKGIEYRRHGRFLISDEEILGPKMYIKKDDSEIYHVLRKYIEEKDYKSIEKYFGMKLGRDKFVLTGKELFIKKEKDQEPAPQRIEVKINKKTMEFELFDRYYVFMPTATIIIDDRGNLHYYQHRIHFTSDPQAIPSPLDTMISEGALYEGLFRPLGIPPSVKIRISTTYTDTTMDIEGTVGKKDIVTYGFVEITKDGETIRIVGWPFIGGAYSIEVPIGRHVDLGKMRIKKVRKHLTKASKIFGPPAWVKIPDDWEILYNHYSSRITYRKDNVSITFHRRKNKITVKTPGVQKNFKPEEIYPILDDFFRDPQIIEFY